LQQQNVESSSAKSQTEEQAKSLHKQSAQAMPFLCLPCISANIGHVIQIPQHINTQDTE